MTLFKRISNWWTPPIPTSIADEVREILRRPQRDRVREICGDECEKCGVSFLQKPAGCRYANDEDFGERLLIRCWFCGFVRARPIEKAKE